MTMISHIRASLLASALMFSSALAVPAFAQEALSLPDLSPEEIAADVQREFNNRTGTTEFIAPTFDPFEQDSSMAGSVSFRSLGAPVTTIDGDVYEDGVLMDMAFYYNSPNDDPFDGRGFTDAAFLSGSLAPAVRRDRRILECSRNVRDVVYDHTYYYAPSIRFSFFRPYRHYGGHHRFGRFDRPYWRNRGFGNRGHGGWGRATFSRRGGYHSSDRRDRRFDSRSDRREDRQDDRARNRRDRDRDNDRSRDRRRTEGGSVVRMDRRGRMNTTIDNRQPRAERRVRDERRSDANRQNNRRNEARRNEARGNEARRTNERSNETRNNRDAAGLDNARRDGSDRNQITRNERRNEVRTTRNRDVISETRNNRGRADIRTARENRATPRPTPRAESRPTPRRNEARSENRRSQPRAEPRPQPRAQPRAQPRPERRSQPRRSENRGAKRSQRPTQTIKSNNREIRGNKRRLNFFPARASYGRDVVRSVDVDCAREETMSVFIPAERLEAARFDGLTILALDNKGQEYPIFVPPNYIEGFNLATAGGFAPSTGVPSVPNVVYREPVTRGPVYNEPAPQTRIEATCPAGTTKQNDGSCLITSGQYPQ